MKARMRKMRSRMRKMTSKMGKMRAKVGKMKAKMGAKRGPRVMRRLITGWLATLGLTDHQEMCGHHSYTDVHIGSWYFPFLFLCCWSFIFGICI